VAQIIYNATSLIQWLLNIYFVKLAVSNLFMSLDLIRMDTELISIALTRKKLKKLITNIFKEVIGNNLLNKVT